MGINRGTDRFLATLNGNVLTAGGSLNLAKGQLGIFETKNNTKNGLKATANFAGAPRNREYEIRLGVAPVALTRTQESKPKASLPFKLGEVVEVKVHAPSLEKSVDEFIVGYDGINADTALTFEVGQREELDIELSGEAIGLFGYTDAIANVKLYFDKEEGQTDQEVVLKAIERAKEMRLKENVNLTEFVEITPVNSEAADPSVGGVSHTFYTLTLADTQDSNALGEVQAQYNGDKVELTNVGGLQSTYTILRPTADGAPTDFNQITSVASQGCEDCPVEYDEYTAGILYNVTLEDDGADSTATVQALPGNIADSAIKQGQKDGVGTYTVVLDNKLTAGEITTFMGANPTATLDIIADLEALCSNDVTTTVAWVAGDVCWAQTEDYTLQLGDKCGEDRLAELSAAYPDLVITIAQDEEEADVEGGCQTVYQTSVTTNIVCEECDDMFTDLFSSEAPTSYDFVDWKKVEPEYSETALMGIRFKAKELISAPGEGLRDAVPFYNSSVRLKLAGGYVTDNYLGLKTGKERFNVKLISRQENLENLGGELWAFDDRDFTYFQGYPRHRNLADGHQNEYAKQLLGEESVLKANAQYVIYTITVAPRTDQGLIPDLVQKMNYMIAVEVGRHAAVESLVNSLAGAAGVEGVQAYGASA